MLTRISTSLALWRALALIGLLAALQGCGNGGGSLEPATNAAPVVTGDFADVTATANQSAPAVTFSGTDDRPADELRASATSSDQAIIADSGLVVTNNGGTFTLSMTPAEEGTTGTATITVVVTDGAGAMVERSFEVTVEQEQMVGLDAFFRDTFARSAETEPRNINSRDFVNDAQDDDFADLLGPP